MNASRVSGGSSSHTAPKLYGPLIAGDGADPRLERRRARRVVAAEADTGGADALEVDLGVGPIGERVEHRRDRDLVVSGGSAA